MNALTPTDAVLRQTSPHAVREHLRQGREIALLDVREEAPFASGHPLFAVNLPLGRIEERVAALIPRRTAPIVVYDNGEDRTATAIRQLRLLGYTDVSALEGDLTGWRDSGGELFIDVNVPSKAFGELVEHVRHTPSLPAEEVHARLERGDDLVILDARRFSEYHTMSIPGGRSVPGGELALRVRDVAPSPQTTVIVNCAGRTRSIIGTQSLVNAQLPNPIFALRNGTIGWTLAGFELDHGATLTAGAPSVENHATARVHALDLAHRAGVRVITAAGLRALSDDDRRTLYRLDVRSPEEYAADHLEGFRSAPGGQLVQATDEWVGVRHATLVLTDTDGVRARMTAHWLRQLGWSEVYVLDDWADLARASGTEPLTLASPLPAVPTIASDDLAAELVTSSAPIVLDLSPSPIFRKGHVPGAHFILPADLVSYLQISSSQSFVLTSPDGVAARIAATQLAGAEHMIRVLSGGTDAWTSAGYPVETGFTETQALSAPIDVYKRPYEGTDNGQAAMQAYLDWEFGLVAQLEKDATHGFFVL